MKTRRRDEQLLRILVLARRLWFAEERADERTGEDADAAAIRAVLHDALLERYGRDYEEVLEAVSQRRGDPRLDWVITLWPRMLLFAEQGFPGWSEQSRARSAGASPIRFALASGPSEPGAARTGHNRSVRMFLFPGETTRANARDPRRAHRVAQRARDPRSFLELRRLAGNAQRSEEARAVLHDALLETLPAAYATAIARAHAFSSSGGGRAAWNVWFFPTRLNRTTRKYGTTNLAFEEHPAFVDRSDLLKSRQSRPAEDAVNRALVVYEIFPTRHLRYVDSEGSGRGEVVDERDGHVMGVRLADRERARRWINRSQSVGALDTAFLRWMRERLLTHYSREALIDWLSQNDRNGAYTDEDAWREGWGALTHAEAADLAFEHVVDTKETLEEMRRHSRRWPYT